MQTADDYTTEHWHRELRARRAKAWAIAVASDCDMVIVYGGAARSESFRYLTNFVPMLGDAFAILTGADDVVCVLNFRWQLLEAQAVSGIDEWYGRFDIVGQVTDLVGQAKPKRVGIIGLERLPHKMFEALQQVTGDAVWVDIANDYDVLRRRKSDLEIAMLRRAAKITDDAFEDIRDFIVPGLTEHDIAARMTQSILSNGAGLSFDGAVISGNNDPIPIRMPTDRKVQPGDSIMIDVGASYQGYQADCTRTFVLGEPNALQLRVWDLVLRAHAATFEKIRPGTPAHTLHNTAREVIEAAGYELVHRIGHGIGLATSFEWPSLNAETAGLIERMTVAIEPGIYVQGAGNMKREDNVLITGDGYEILTNCSYELVIPV